MNLTPCPFCPSASGVILDASNARLDGRRMYYFRCHGCGTLGPEAASIEEAAGKWNTRDEPQHPTGEPVDVMGLAERLYSAGLKAKRKQGADIWGRFIPWQQLPSESVAVWFEVAKASAAELRGIK